MRVPGQLTPRWAGIGPYTSRAVASIAAGEAVAVVDANVVRVLARLRCLAGDSASAAAARQQARLAGQLLDPARPGDFNQARPQASTAVPGRMGRPALGSRGGLSLCGDNWPLPGRLLVNGTHIWQAVMELGATVCTPASPGCGGCPLREVCQAFQRQQAHLAAGRSPENAPAVTQYPGKVCGLQG